MNEISFEIEGKIVTLYFGMDAYEAILDKQLYDALTKDGSTFKSCSYIVYGGLINQWVVSEEKPKPLKPTYKQAYELTQQIWMLDKDIQNSIFKCYNESLADDLLRKTIENVSGLKKKIEDLQSQTSKQTGTE